MQKINLLFIFILTLIIISCKNGELEEEILKSKYKNKTLLKEIENLQNENKELIETVLELKRKLMENEYLGIYKPVKVKEINTENSNFRNWHSVPDRLTLKIEKRNNKYIYYSIDISEKMRKIKEDTELLDTVISYNDAGLGQQDIRYKKSKMDILRI